MSTPVFTHATWRVRPGNEESFVAAWSQLAQDFSALPQQPFWGTLIRSLAEPTLFVSFGPWPSSEAVQAMREDPVSLAALERLRALCDDATPGPYELVRHVQLVGPNPLLTRLVGYHHWATSRLVGALGALPADALDRPVGGSFGTLRGLLRHILGTEEVWLERLRGHSPSALPDLTSFNAVSDFQAAWGIVQTEQHDFISSLGNEKFEAPISYINFRGEAWAYPLDAVLLHLVNHGTYHRGQLAHVLRQLGQAPPATDYLVFVDENLNTLDEPVRG